MRIRRFSEARGIFEEEISFEPQIHCFGGGGGGAGGSAGDFEGTNFGGDKATAGGNLSGRGGSTDNDRRVDSSGNTTNFNIDRSQPSVTGTVNGKTTTMYGTQENLDKAIAGGDINVTPSPSDTYTPGTDKAASSFSSAVASSPFMPDASATPGTMAAVTPSSFAPTSITSQAASGPALSGGYSPVTRGMSPFEMTLADSLGPRPDVVSSVRMGNFDDPEVQRTMAELDAISARMGGDPYGPSPQQNMSPVDTVNIFDQFEQPLDASVDPSRPDLARDPSRPAVSIRGATPADMITAEARAAANQLLGEDRTRPTAAEVAAANARFGPTGMQPTTTEVDAYNQAINEQIAGQLGVDSYSPGSFNAMKEVQDRALAGQYNVVGLPGSEIPGATRAIDFSDIEAADARDQGIMAAVNAAREVELETGVPAQEVAGIIGLTGPAVSTSRTPQEMALTGSQTFDVQPSVQATFDPRISAGVMSDSPQQFDLEQMQLANDLIARSTAAANRTPVTLDRAMQKDREGYFSPGEYEIADQGPLDTTDFDRAVAEEEARAAAQGPLDTNQFQEQPEDEAIYGGRGTAAPQAATLTDAERMSQQGVDAEMTGIPIGATAERREIAGQDPRAPDYTLEEAQANLEAARAEAYRDKQFGFDTGLPSSIDVFGAKVPTGVGVLEGVADALFNPDAALANAIAERGIRTIDGNPVPESAANYNPQGLDVVTAGGPIGEGGRTAAYDASGNIVYDSRGIGGQFSDLLSGNRPPENIQELYDRQRTIDEQQREMQGGDGGGQMLPPVEKPPEDVPPEEYRGRDVVNPYQYQPRGPLTYAYTGLPSLAPTRLRPSYTARKTFSPLFPVS